MEKCLSACAGRILAAAIVLGAADARAQDPQPQEPAHVHDMEHMDMNMNMGGWSWMQDGSAYLLANHQGGYRGGDDIKVPSWWMGMGTRQVGRGSIALTGMVSLDPALVGRRGYREVFQVGEALDGRPLIDRQHPHDLWMQMSAAWHVTVGAQTGLTLVGALAGEPALGPVAFMHRASAAAIPLAPLGHHTFDSTHVSFGVATAAIDRGRIAVEGSVFNGREPDQNRWDMDFGRMDSVSGRVWLRPSPQWSFQVSSGRLVEPEQLGHGNVVRSTASASYLKGAEPDLLAVTVGLGMNASDDVTRHAAFGELTRAWGRTTGSVRMELVQVETELLLTGALPTTPEGEARRDAVGAMTLGGQRELATRKGISASLGVNTTFYRVPEALRGTHGTHPVSLQVFVQLRPVAGAMGRMWNMRMGGPGMHESRP